MKRLNRFTELFIVMLLLTVAAGCSEQEEVPGGIDCDFTKPSVCFLVYDGETGEDLLDPASEYSILGQPISVIYRNKRYGVEMEQIDYPLFPLSPARPSGLRLAQLEVGGQKRWTLAFGEFDPGRNNRGETFTVDWGDGRFNLVRFDLYTVWKNRDYRIFSPIWLDGEKRTGEGYAHWVLQIVR